MKRFFNFLLLTLSASAFAQYMHRDGQQVLDQNGQPIILRGLGLGGWMVQEGYMLQTDAFAGPQHKIREKITQLIGAANTETFYQAYRDNGITKRDIDSLKAWGFNSIRLPMHYNLYTLPIEQETGGGNTWLDEGFERTDQLLQWCEQNQMYLILDMHATPGGQGKDANISDYDSTKPSLWESEANKTKLVALWRKLADRYKNSPWIGGYDLINEPNWAFTGSNQNGCDENSNAPLRQLYIQITNAIREVDTHHMIIIEGNCWGNNYNGLLSASNGLWDANMALSFHKYWNYNTQSSIQGILNLRNTYNVPIWLGESGENSNVWFKDAISLVEANNIGWAWWPMKKIDNIAGPASVTKTADYQTLLNYWTNGGTQPTQAFAFNALMQIAENYKMQNVTLHPDVIDAMFRQVQSAETKKYKNHPIPGKVYATEFDMGHNGVAYYDKDVANYRTDTGTFEAWNTGWAMRNDGVDIQACSDAVNNGFQVTGIQPNEWLSFSITASSQMAYDIDVRYSGAGGKLYFEDASGKISETIALPSTGNTATFQTATLTDVILNSGLNHVKLFFETGGYNVNWFELRNAHATTAAAFKTIDASTSILGDKVNVIFNKQLQTGINFSASNFVLKVNGNAVGATIAYSAQNDSALVFTPATAINPSDVVTLTYSGSNVVATDATTQAPFTDKPVTNRVGNILGISGTVQAEQFYANNGFQTETTSDVGGGQNVGYTDAGDTLDYLVNIQATGSYKIEYRVSGESQAGSAKLQLVGDTVQDIQTINFAPTGGWQTWQTVESTATLPAGRYILRFNVLTAGFNLNWIKFTYQIPDDDGDNVGNDADVCPNTPSGDVVDFNGCTIFSLASNNFSVLTNSETCRSANNGSISITAASNHDYVATLTGDANQTVNFTDSATFGNLEAGNYHLCVTLPTISSYEQCYDLAISEPEDLSVYSRVLDSDFKVRINLEGSATYRIALNGTQYLTDQDSIVLDLVAGKNDLVVKAEAECQGIYRETIVMDDAITLYPNPVREEMVYVALPSVKAGAVSLEVFSLLGKKIISENFFSEQRTVAFNAAQLASGTYALKVTSESGTYNTKFVKL